MDKASPVFMESASPAAFGYDFTDPFMQYTNTGYGLPMSQSSPRLSFSNLNLSNTLSDFNYPSAFTPVPTTPNARPYTPTDPVSPALINMSQNNLSASELSGDGFNSSGKRSRGTSSGRSPSPPTPHGGSSLVHRQPLRQAITTRAAAAKERPSKRRSTKSDDIDSDEDLNDIEYAPSSVTDGGFEGPRDSRVINKRREEIRRQRIESEQRRRDELREGYRKLKDVLPVSNQKSSKVSLLDRATLHIKYLELTQQQLQQRLQSAEMETQRLRLVNEKLSLSAAEHNQQAAAAAHAAAAHAAMPGY